MRLRPRRGPLALVLAALAGAVGVGAVGMAAARDAATATTPSVREYWVAAVPVTWNVAPNGRNAIEGERFTRAQTVFRTVAYRQFTKDFAKQLPAEPGNPGLQGPLLRARVGDQDPRPLPEPRHADEPPAFHALPRRPVPLRLGRLVHPRLLRCRRQCQAGETFTYRLEAEQSARGVWPYHDHSPSMMESIEGGLFGTLSILSRDEPAPDREFVVYLVVQLGFITINGRAFVGNTPVFRARVGDVVQWDVLTIGDDFHTFHVHGHRWIRVTARRGTRR